jgi:hypothetical protein
MLGRSLLIKASGARLLYPGYVQDYLDRVTAADVAAGNSLGLERGVTDAFSTCLQALVADGILGVSGGVLAQAASLVKASCFMQGARTLPGSLVPLADDMPKPTNFNFVAGAYSRRTGLLSNGTQYLDSNRSNNADPQNSNHNAVYATAIGAGNGTFMAAGGFQTAGTNFMAGGQSDTLFTRCRSLTGTAQALPPSPGFLGHSRSGSANYTVRANGSSNTVSVASDGLESSSILLYRRGNVTVPTYGSHRLAFYSIGESLNLAILDARITALSNAIQAAIAP